MNREAQHRIAASFLNITAGVRDHHNYRLDKTYTGRYRMRLPNGQLVFADEYAERLAEYRAAGDGDLHDHDPT